MVDVFISYSRENGDRVRLLADKVRELGYHLWWDDELPPHKSYGDVITEKIGSAKAAIVVWSETAVQSEWVRAEADVARNQKKLIQITLDEAMPPMPFNQIQFARLGDWQGEDDHRGWQKVIGSLADLCGPPPNATAAVPPAPLPPVPAPTSFPIDTPPSAEDVRDELDRRRKRRPIVVAIGVVAIAALASVGFTLWQGDDNADPIATVDASEAAAPDDADTASVWEDFGDEAVVDDPNGFAYIRLSPSNNAAVVGRVVDGDVFRVLGEHGRWWPVTTEDGAEGFIDSEQIRLLDTGTETNADADDAAGE